MMSRLEEIANDVNLSPAARNEARTAYNAIRDHLTQNDLAGALRDVHGKPVTVSGSGKTYDHQEEVENALASLERFKDRMLNEMNHRAIMEARSANPNFLEYQQMSKNVDAVTEMMTKIEEFLKIGK